ncbi:hypothetical protein ACIRJM_48285 [Streptomyces sp. NPDC102405]|uniref:hypothetical protein n=1 Tax=Streptomyces sp. NPDC102405 TaxID=3366170 RepID=UPI0037FB9C95
MADDEKEASESAETQDPPPPEKPAGLPDGTPNPHSRPRPWTETTYRVLGIMYYGSHLAALAWMTAQERLFPLVQRYM